MPLSPLLSMAGQIARRALLSITVRRLYLEKIKSVKSLDNHITLMYHQSVMIDAIPTNLTPGIAAASWLLHPHRFGNGCHHVRKKSTLVYPCLPFVYFCLLYSAFLHRSLVNLCQCFALAPPHHRRTAENAEATQRMIVAFLIESLAPQTLVVV